MGEAEDEVGGAEPNGGTVKPATFEGRLQLSSFLYVSSTPSTPSTSPAPSRILRRSSRLCTPSQGSGSAAALARAADSPTSARKGRKRPPSPGAASRTATSPLSPEEDAKTRTKKGPRTKTISKKSPRPSSAYAPPSTYAHLPHLPDAVAPNLLVFFVGLNPGIETARRGHAYAHPSNLFWKLLFSSGVTPRLCRPDEDRQLPARYGLGFTNIVARPSRNGAELSRREMDDGVAALEAKARRWRPESVCIVGKSIWESVWRVRRGAPVGKAFRYGWQDEEENMGVVEGDEWAGARVFVASSTSGLAATLSPAQKQEIWAELGAWVTLRRAERDAELHQNAQMNGSTGS